MTRIAFVALLILACDNSTGSSPDGGESPAALADGAVTVSDSRTAPAPDGSVANPDRGSMTPPTDTNSPLPSPDAQPMMGDTVARDANMPEAPISTTPDAGSADSTPRPDAVAASDSLPASGPSVMDVMAKLTVVPKGVAFGFRFSRNGIPLGDTMFGVSIQNITINKQCVTTGQVEQALFSWTPARMVWSPRIQTILWAIRPLIDADFSQNQISKTNTTPLAPDVTKTPMSLEDWIQKNKNDLDAAIAAVNAAPEASCR